MYSTSCDFRIWKNIYRYIWHVHKVFLYFMTAEVVHLYICRLYHMLHYVFPWHALLQRKKGQDKGVLLKTVNNLGLAFQNVSVTLVQLHSTTLLKISAASWEHTVWCLWSILAAGRKIALAQNNNKKNAIHKVVMCWGMNSSEESLAVADILFKLPVDRQINGVCFHMWWPS